MGSSEMDQALKEGKDGKEAKAANAQDQSSATPGMVNADWSGFQAYSPMPPHGFLASSPQPHPYMWGVQPVMPPYGTPPHPYVAMYPHGGIYAHPSIPMGSYPFSPFAMPSTNGVVEVSGNMPSSMEDDNKLSEVKEKLPIKRSKASLGSLNIITGKSNELGKASGASAHGDHSKSVMSGSEGTSEGSDANYQDDSCIKSGGRHDSSGAEESQNGGVMHGSQNGEKTPGMINRTMAVMPNPAAGAPGGLPGPTTNLNIGMAYWAAATLSTLSTLPALPAPVAGGMVSAGSRESLQSLVWPQDERELKRQRRKQSNRESARRSRFRKQTEGDELAQRAEALKEENATLRAEVNHLRSECEQLLAQNASLKERLGEAPGQEDVENEML